MNVLLIMPYHNDLIHAVSLPLGIMSIGTYLQSHGVNVKLCDFSIKRTSLKTALRGFKPDIVGLSFPSAKSVDGIRKISKELRPLGVPIVWGGQFVDVGVADTFFKTGLVDILSYSEGEETWLELVRWVENGGDLGEIKGIAYQKDGKVVFTPKRPFMDPADLPRIDYTLVDVPMYFQYLYGCKNLLYVYLSKGCTAHCTFCFNTACHRNTRRRRALEVSISEITELVTKYGADGFYFADELGFQNDKEMYEICDAFEATGLSFHWGFQTRVGTLSPEAIRRSAECGCRWMDFGVESGSKEMLKKLVKGMPYDKIVPTFHACRENGIITIANFIIGLPGETPEQMQETIDLAKRLDSTQNTFAKYLFLPNTPLGQEVLASFKDRPDFAEMTDYKQIDFFQNNHGLSSIPQKDLNTVQSYFLLKAIFRKDYSDTRSYDLLLKFIFTVLKNASTMHFDSMIKAFAEIISDFTRFCFDVTFHKDILRKYGLL
ncbi:MAG: B12-binding domain-containing radical SAM protein [Clostridia bacterium]|nr:B12-binding domain-containing radical SAM protein [Clostridia bacterium]